MIPTTFLAALTFTGLSFAIPVIPPTGAPLSTVAAPDTDNSASTLSTGFVVRQVNTKPRRPGPIHLAAAFAKYGGDAPKDVLDAARRSRSGLKRGVPPSGSVTANPEPYDQEYLCQVTVGGQTLDLDFDTGSADLWVFSSELPAASQSGHNIYNPSKSTTSSKLAGQTWNIQYGDGSSANGDVYNDTVKIGASTVTSQAVEAAQSVSGDFVNDQNCDGLVGLSFSTLNTVTPNRQRTFVDTAVSQGLAAVFTANLKKGAAGNYGFGQIDTSQYNAAPTYAPVDSSKGFWAFTAAGYGIGATYNQSSLSGIVDTGTSLLALPSNIVTTYWNSVSGAGYDSNYGAYTFPCSATLPNFSIGLGSSQTKYVLPGNYLNFAPLGDGSNKCYGGLQSSDGMGVNIFGAIFIKAFFVIFDKRNLNGPRVGFATKPI